MIKALKKLVYRSLSLEGYLRLMQRGYFALYGAGLLRLSRNYDYHYFARKLIRPGDTVIDIGANLGYYSILFARWVGPAGKVYAVEPIGIYNRIYREKSRKYPNITLYPYALGEEEKTIEMVTSPGVGYLRTGLPHVYDPQRDGRIEAAEFRFEAEMKQPSKLFGTLERIDYIKCDIEGFEYNVLHEMRDVIARHLPMIQVELWTQNEERLTAMLTDLGYTPCKLTKGKLVRYEPGSGIAGDHIFVPAARAGVIAG